MKYSKLIMIVDDDMDDVDFFNEALNEVDHTIKSISAINGRDALDKLESLDVLPDFIFLDLNMPQVNGVKCLTEIKKNPELSEIPVIIYTTSRNKEDINKTRKLGAVHYLTKPSNFDQLCDAIKFIVLGSAFPVSLKELLVPFTTETQ